MSNLHHKLYIPLQLSLLLEIEWLDTLEFILVQLRVENWNVEFDDGDYKQSKPKGNDSKKSGKHHLTNIEDIPMVSALDRSKRGLIIVQRAKKRRVYYTDHGDTPNTIAKRHKVDAGQIVRDNKRRGGDYKSLTQKSQLQSIHRLSSPCA